jgi:starch-binding outer membrane protein, SusD/RagB family
MKKDESNNGIMAFRQVMLGCSLTIAFSLASCESFLEIDLPKSKIAKEIIFNDDVTATTAINGVYHDMLNPASFASGSNVSTMGLAGLTADEFIDYNRENLEILEFETNTLTPFNSSITTYWDRTYKTIYQANSIIEGLAASSNVTLETKNQLMGEALFIRAFSHFYLVNIFGDVPIVLTTDYRINSVVQRKAVSDVYDQIVNDLITAQDLLTDAYPTDERTRPNQAAATSLLSRVYLYMGKWSAAEAEASAVIENSSQYNLVSDIDDVFLANSTEAIWQLKPVLAGFNTNEGYFFAIGSYPYYYVLSEQIGNAFEPDDNRYSSWVGSFDTGDGLVYFPFKYKIFQLVDSNTPPAEYSIVLRLAEQYLIRAEARAQQGKLAEAIADVDMIRSRANLPLIQDNDPGITQENLLLAIEHERQIELFAEWGHRWFDLKRTNRSNTVLATVKTEWNTEDNLWPIPQSEFNRNTNLGNQNSGY